MPETHLRTISRRAAAAVLIVLLGCIGVCLAVRGPSGTIEGDPSSSLRVAVEDGDWELYRSIERRLRAGEGYYQALAAELHPRGYP